MLKGIEENEEEETDEEIEEVTDEEIVITDDEIDDRESNEVVTAL